MDGFAPPLRLVCDRFDAFQLSLVVLLNIQ